MGREFELKYAATPEDLSVIQEDFGEFTPFNMETTYYDTPDGALAQRKVTLRRRLENGLSVCTLKTPSTVYGRGEWEVDTEHIEDAIGSLCKQCGDEELPGLLAGGVVPVCGARFLRLAKLVEIPGCTVEIALDHGVLLGGGKEMPLCEAEVEVKEGSEAVAVSWTRAMAHKYGLKLERRSKFLRASMLAKGEIHG